MTLTKEQQATWNALAQTPFSELWELAFNTHEFTHYVFADVPYRELVTYYAPPLGKYAEFLNQHGWTLRDFYKACEDNSEANLKEQIKEHKRIEDLFNAVQLYK